MEFMPRNIIDLLFLWLILNFNFNPTYLTHLKQRWKQKQKRNEKEWRILNRKDIHCLNQKTWIQNLFSPILTVILRNLYHCVLSQECGLEISHCNNGFTKKVDCKRNF
jgi:hypothetical protein